MDEETKKEDRKEYNPIVDFKVNLSKDKKYLINTTTITSIKPINFIKKVLEGN
jgi:hypothetical protein